MKGNGSFNGSGEHHEEEDNVVPFPEKPRPPREPLINLPVVSKAMTVSILVIQAALHFVPDPVVYDIFMRFGFVPGIYTGRVPFSVTALIAPLTYMLLHGGWGHVLINAVSAAAFGTGVERWMGGKRMLLLFVLSGLASVLVHFALNPFSADPVVGASGGLSGLFAAVLIMMQMRGAPMGRYGIWPFVLLWIGISALFGVTGGPGGGTIAWAAHVGGFAAGLLLVKPLLRLRI